MDLANYILGRLKEPSSWAALGPLLTAIGWKISPELWDSIAIVCMGICNTIAIFLKEKQKS